ncbi:cell envelope biogenesis protein TolA [Bradyrhizobium sp. CCBAU 45384]|uniref:cell envelope biogenesis protein TolA n=1 Tax=Bradyrhizobium sp. CCBAU 45384 TaxID=858428 RepID=UPI002305F185|nr:cell envelope biogenesis protein TolA [Bradyrhizobium sp. CCBAU 45384]MDA9409684.1 TolA protein [Bradyrhizobium sp. CCBAU 45384]
MARKLKTYQTSLGFHDLAIAAPSMKAALEAWGAGSNLFHQGLAKETDDPEVVAATMAKPGVVLRRAAGSSGRFSEQSDIPSQAAADRAHRQPETRQSKPHRRQPSQVSSKAARQAAANYEKEQRRREAQSRREEAARAKVRERQERAIAKAQAALEEAEQEHGARLGAIEAERAAVNARAAAEDERWTGQKAKLTAALRRARNSE